MMNDFFYRLRALFRRVEVEAELGDELGFHFEQQVQKFQAAGVTQEEAIRQARLLFGGLDQVKEECRDARGVGFAETLAVDVRYGLRMLRKNPGFTLIAVLTLALGIGASTAVFSVVEAILLKPLPYVDPDRIVMLWWKAPVSSSQDADQFPWSKRDFLHFSETSTSFRSIGAFRSDYFNLVGSGEPTRLDGLRASAGFFPALGVTPTLGRNFTPEEDQPGHEFEVMLSDQLWRDRFGADAGILGRTIALNDETYTVVGVMPRGFFFPHAEEMPSTVSFPARIQLWVPLDIPAAPHGSNDLAVIGRLKPGVARGAAEAELRLFGNRMEAQFPQTAKGWYNPNLVSLTRQIVGDTRRPLLLILGAVGIVLLIASSNVASLLLTRSLGRRREFALRAGLGAGRGRLVRQLLTESLLLAFVGGSAGVLFAEVAIYFVGIFGPSNIPRLREVSLDLPVLAFTFAVTVMTGILFGLTPAIGATRENLVDSLKEGGSREGGGRTHAKIRNGLLVCQIALALILVVAAGLLVRTFDHMLDADAGFNADRVLTFQLSLPASKYKDTDRMSQLYQRALQRLQTLPGVESVGLVSYVPMGGATDATVIRIPDHPSTNEKDQPYANYSFASTGYFSALGTPLIRGRDLLESDTSNSMLVTVINSAMARKYWPGEDPIGKQVGVADLKWRTRTVVGIVADIKHLSLREEPDPEMYVPYTQNEIKIWPSMQTMQVALRTKADPTSAMESVREAIRLVDADLPVAQIATLTTLVDNSMAQPRFAMLLLVAFGTLALVLASIGMYGVISYSVSQRSREIGIRMALGAERQTVLAMIMGQGARVTGLGIVIGLGAALFVAQLMTKFLYGIVPIDLVTFSVVSVLLVAVAIVACYLPARRATRVDPMVVLREQ